MAKRRGLLLSTGGVLAFFLVIQLAIMQGWLNVYLQGVLILASIFVTYALGLNLIYGFNGQFSLGHAAFYGIGAYTSAIMTKLIFDGNPLSFPLALAAGAVAAGFVGYLIGRPILRLRSDYLGIATLGFGIIVTVFFNNADALLPGMGGARGMTGITKMTNFTWAYFVAVLAVIIVRNLVYSSHGRAIVSVREDEVAANTMGIDTTKYKTIAFVVGCSLAGLAGGLYAHQYLFLNPPSFDFLKSIDVLMIVVLGGLGSMTGTIIAAAGWIFLLEGLRNVLPQEYLEWRMVIIPVVLILTMILRPQGLMGGIELGPLRPSREASRIKAGLAPGQQLPGEEAPVGTDHP